MAEAIASSQHLMKDLDAMIQIRPQESVPRDTQMMYLSLCRVHTHDASRITNVFHGVNAKKWKYVQTLNKWLQGGGCCWLSWVAICDV